MVKSTKSSYVGFRVPEEMKRRITDKAHLHNMEPSRYLVRLVEKDLSGLDITDTEKPLLKEFSNQVGLEISRKVQEHIEKMYIKNIERDKRLQAAISLCYRVSMRAYVELKNITSSKIESSQLKDIERTSKESLSKAFRTYLDILSKENVEEVEKYLLELA